MFRMKAWSTSWRWPNQGNSRSWAAKNAAAPRTTTSTTAIAAHIRRKVDPSDLRSCEGRSHANIGYIEAEERWTRSPIQYGCCSVKIGCQNGNNGTSTNHSIAEVRMAQGRATHANVTGGKRAVH